MAQLKDTTINGDLKVVNGTIQGGFYKPGDTIHTTWCGGGYVTSSGTRFTFSIPVPPLIGVTSCKVTACTLTVRQNGNYVINDENALTGGTVDTDIDATSIRIHVKRNVAPSNVMNNDGYGLVTTIDLEFS